MFNWIKSHLPLILVIFFYLLLILKYSDFVPMWDAYVNVNNFLLKAVQEPFFLPNFDDAGHPTLLYYLVLSVSQYFDYGNQYLLNLTVLFLSILSILAFYGLTGLIFSGKKHYWERLQLTFLYAFFPAIVGSALHVSADYGMLVFFLIFLWLIMTGRRTWAVVSSIFLIFTKEPATGLYFAVIITDFLFEIIKKKPDRVKLVSLISSRILFLLPLLLHLVRYLLWTYVYKIDAIYVVSSSLIVNESISEWPTWDRSKILLSYILGIFVINYNWILSIMLLSGIISGFIKLVSGKVRNIQDIMSSNQAFILVTFLQAVVILTLFKTFTNLRYFLPVYPLLILMSYLGIHILLPGSYMRRIILIFICLLFFYTIFRTTDPVSIRIYGAFPFGRHKMLNMTSITGECCGLGRDQLVYNLEYTNIHYLLNQIFTDIKPDEKTAFVFTPWEGPTVLERLDNNFHRTLKIKDTIPLEILTWRFETIAQKPSVLYFIDYPNNDPVPYLKHYLSFYTLEKERVYDRNGYQMKVYTLKLKT